MYDAKREAIITKYHKEPERTLLYAAYASCDDGPEKIICTHKTGMALKLHSKRIAALTYCMISLGYEGLSDEEQELKDGTHELYMKE